MNRINRLALNHRHFLTRFASTTSSSSVAGTPLPDATNASVTPAKKEMIWALKKEKGQGLSAEDSDADAGFEVLALMHKSNVRFTLKHFRDVDQPKSDAEAEDEEKHLKPQHRWISPLPLISKSISLSHSTSTVCICHLADDFSHIRKLVLAHHFNEKR